MTKESAKQFLVYVGTYTKKGSEGIYVYRLDTSSGALEPVSKATGVENPSFLAIHPSRRYLYAVDEVREFKGQPGGAVSAFAIDPKTGDLTYLNQQLSRGAGPCHLSVDQTGKFVLAANYSAGSAASFARCRQNPRVPLGTRSRFAASARPTCSDSATAFLPSSSVYVRFLLLRSNMTTDLLTGRSHAELHVRRQAA